MLINRPAVAGLFLKQVMELSPNARNQDRDLKKFSRPKLLRKFIRMLTPNNFHGLFSPKKLLPITPENLRVLPISSLLFGDQFPGRSNRTQCRQRLATAATFFRGCCPGAKPQRWGSPLVSRFGVITRI